MEEEKKALEKEVEDDATVEDGLMSACKGGFEEIVDQLLKVKADAAHQDPTTGVSPLMLAAKQGSQSIVQKLLTAGAPWNALDAGNFAAGDYAAEAGHNMVYERLVNHACNAELILSHITQRPPPNLDYLKQKLVFKDDQILDANGDAVMMGWEGPLMKLHAELMCHGQDGKKTAGDVLNVGFGLGLIDTYLQDRRPRSHTIIEAHPDVHAWMLEQGWDKKPGVTIHFGRWQDVVGKLGQFDGIFFDTYGEHYDDMNDFHKHLPRLLKGDGIYTFFNGLAASTSAFFHTVYCRLVEVELMDMDFTCEYIATNIESIFAGDKDKEIWEGVKRKYWVLSQYNLPIVKHMDLVDCCERDSLEQQQPNNNQEAEQKASSSSSATDDSSSDANKKAKLSEPQ